MNVKFLKSGFLVILALSSFAYCGNDMFWICPEPNGLWTVPTNWLTSPGEPNYPYYPGYIPPGEADNWNKAYARIQQGSVCITDNNRPNGRVERLYLGGPSGAALNFTTGNIVNIYKFFTGNGAGWSAVLNQSNGQLNVTATGSSQPYIEFGSGTTVYNLSGGTFKCSNNIYAPYNSGSGTQPVSTLTMNISGGTWNPVTRVYLGNTPDSVATVNLSSGLINEQGKQFIIGLNGGTAYYNQTGGTYQHLNSNTDTGFFIGKDSGYGEAAISGGSFDCQVPVKVYNGVFRINGSGASNISAGRIASHQYFGNVGFDVSNQTLAIVLDSGGVTPIRITNSGKANLDNATLTVNILAGFNGTPGTIYPILYAPAADTNAISASQLRLVVLSPTYDFEWFIENDTENGGQWLKLRQLTVSVWNGGTGLWNVAGNWTGGVPDINKSTLISSGTVNLPTSGICAARKINIGGSNPTLNVYTGSTLNTAGELNISMADLNTANINISGGTVTVNGDTTVAAFPASAAKFNQTGGDVNITGNLNMGYNTDTSGSPAEVNYTMSGGTFRQKGYVFRLGYANSKGYFTQTGGDVVFNVDVNSSCRLGYSDGWAEYVISGGSLTATTNFVVDSGHFEVLGSSVSGISVDRFRVTDNGTFLVGLGASGCTPVVTTGAGATFEDGSNIVVRRLPGFSGTFQVFYDVLHAATDVNDQGLNLSCEDANYTFESRIVSDGGSGYILQVGIGWRNQKAYDSWPEDNGLRCYQDSQTLSWTNPLPSVVGGNVLCDVWFADASVDPNFTNPVKIVNKQPVNSVTTTLTAGKKYLWRVDIYDQSYGTEHKVTGDVWDFRTNPVAVKALEWKFENSTTNAASYQQAINGGKIIATASGAYSIDVAQNVVNGWGLEGLKHCLAPSGTGYGMWRVIPNFYPGVTAPGCSTTGCAWIKFDFDKAYNLGKMWVWNHNAASSAGALALLWGMKDVTIEYSANGTTYSTLGTYTLNDATHASGYEHNTEINFNGVSAKSVVMTADLYNGTYGGDYVGLSEVRFGLHNTTATETNTPDTAGTCMAKCNGSVGFGHSPVYSSAQCIDINDGFDYIYSDTGSAALPTDPNLPWTINCFVLADRMPDDGLIFAGFGNVFDPNEDTKRYIDAKPDGYIGFWGDSNETDLTGTAKFDLRKWQMLTATYDGVRVRLYKNAEFIGSKNVVGDFNIPATKALIVPRTGRKAGGIPVHDFYGKIDDVMIYNGVLSVVEMQQMITRLPIMQDIDTDGSVDKKDLAIVSEEWLQTASEAGDVNDSGFVTWTEGFEDGNGFKSRWTAYTGDWTGKTVVTDPCAPQGSSVLMFTLPSNYMQRSIGNMPDVFEVSWYYRAADANGTGDSVVSVVDSQDHTLAAIHHTTENGSGKIYANTGMNSYTFASGTGYVKVTLRVDYSIGKCALFINNALLESGFVLSNIEAGPASFVRLRKYTDQYPVSCFDAVTVSESALSVEYPVSDLNGNGFVNFEDFAVFAEQWLSFFGE